MSTEQIAPLSSEEENYRFLLALAMTVDRMRRLQKQRSPYEPMSNTAQRAGAEEEVDKIISTILTPTTPAPLPSYLIV